MSRCRLESGLSLADGSYGITLRVQAVLREEDEEEVLHTATSGAGSVVLDRTAPTISVSSVTPAANAAG